jgi:hypothetical protein
VITGLRGSHLLPFDIVSSISSGSANVGPRRGRVGSDGRRILLTGWCRRGLELVFMLLGRADYSAIAVGKGTIGSMVRVHRP